MELSLKEIEERYGWDNYIYILGNYIYTNCENLLFRKNDLKIIEKQMFIPDNIILSIIKYNNINYIDSNFINNLLN